MKIRNILMVLAVFAAVAMAAVLFILTTSAPEEQESETPVSNFTQDFTIYTFAHAGDFGYVRYSSTTSGELTFLALNETPKKSIYILRDSNAIDAGNFDAFVDSFTYLQQYGYTIEVVSFLATITDGIYIIPTGAMPYYALDDLTLPNRTTVYFGRKDLLIQNGIKNIDWYSPLTDEQKSRLIILNSTLNEFYENNRTLPQTILDQNWALVGKVDVTFEAGNNTLSVPMKSARYLRLIYHNETGYTLFDSPELPELLEINASPSSIFPFEKSIISIALSSTASAGSFLLEKNDVVIYQEPIPQVHDPQLFFFDFVFNESGDYIMRLVDSTGDIASGFLHVKKLNLILQETRASRYIFNITVDGIPVESGEAIVRLNHSTQSRKYFIRDGLLSVNARLKSGDNTFVIKVFNTENKITIQNNRESLTDVYVKYGIPGIIAIILVYAFAYMSRRPVYRIHFGDSGTEIRTDVSLAASDALSLFPQIRRKLRMPGPITAKEFALALKQYITDGAEVTDGNVEAILKQLSEKGNIESYLGYYQLKGEGNVRKNVLHRVIREILIEHGIAFTSRGRILVTADFEIGFFGDRFDKKAYIILEDLSEKNAIYQKLPQDKRAFIQLQEQTGKIEFITPTTLKQIL